MALFGSDILTETQKALTNLGLVFKRVGVRNPWKIVYEHNKDLIEPQKGIESEWVDVSYENDSIFYIGNGYLDGSTVVESGW